VVISSNIVLEATVEVRRMGIERESSLCGVGY
jgi:hypothetical protein